MGLRAADGVGVSVGQPDRIDQHSEARQEELRAGTRLEIPKNGIERPRDQRLDPQEAARLRNGWAQQEQAANQRGSLWQSGKLKTWETFAGGRGRQDAAQSRGAVVIDNTQGKVKTPVARESSTPPQPGVPRDGWSSMRIAHQRAARFQEYNEESVNAFLGKGPRRGGGGTTRRRAVLKDR